MTSSGPSATACDPRTWAFRRTSDGELRGYDVRNWPRGPGSASSTSPESNRAATATRRARSSTPSPTRSTSTPPNVLIGLLDAEEPNLTRYVFTHPQARITLVDWDRIADEQVFNLWLGPSTETFEWFTADFATVAGAEFTRRLHRHIPPAGVPLRITHPHAPHQLRWNREVLELPAPDAQQLVLLLPADDATAAAVRHLCERPHRTALRAV